MDTLASMGLRRWLREDGEQRTLGALENPHYPITSQTVIDLLTGPPAFSGVHVSPFTAMSYSAVHRCVSLISGTLASLPIRSYRDQPEGGRVEVPWSLMQEPYPNMTAYEWQELLCVHLLLWGNSYHLIIRSQMGDQILRLLPLAPWSVSIRRERGTQLNPSGKIYRVDVEGGSSAEYTPWEMLHVPGLGFDGLRGYSPIRLMRQGIGLGLAQEEFGSRFFSNGSNVGGVLSPTEQIPDKDTAERLRLRWQEKYAGLAHSHETALLTFPVNYNRLGISPEDSQFLQSREFQVQDIARFYGIPLHMVQDAAATSNWGTGVAQHGAQWMAFGLRNWMARIEQRLSMHLLPRKQNAKFDTTDLLRGSPAERAAFYTAMVGIKAISVDEVRDLEGWKPIAPSPPPNDPNVPAPVPATNGAAA